MKLIITENQSKLKTKKKIQVITSSLHRFEKKHKIVLVCENVMINKY